MNDRIEKLLEAGNECRKLLSELADPDDEKSQVYIKNWDKVVEITKHLREIDEDAER